MNGKIIVIDGLDGSGKSTQAQLALDKLAKKHDKIKLVSFPDYSKPSSALVKMYLNGEFSQNADDVNAYAASSFYAVDRYASFKQYWQADYEDGAIIIASRYVSSNAIHQMVKLPKEKWNDFLVWLSDYEYEKLGLPRPDKIIFLDMSRDVADKLIMSRYDGDDSKKDIHESNMQYLQKCTEAAMFAAKAENWSVIRCCDGINPLEIDVINKEILKEIESVL